MSKYLGYLICIIISSYGYAMETTIDFKSNQKRSFANTTTKEQTIQCQVIAVSNVELPIYIKANKGSGLVNGTSIAKGQTMILTVKTLQVVVIKASSGAEAEFTNLSSYPLRAICG